jgi:hypothetical protein
MDCFTLRVRNDGNQSSIINHQSKIKKTVWLFMVKTWDTYPRIGGKEKCAALSIN